jgi:hypothetical protein
VKDAISVKTDKGVNEEGSLRKSWQTAGRWSKLVREPTRQVSARVNALVARERC